MQNFCYHVEMGGAGAGAIGLASCMSVIQSPFSMILPTKVFFPLLISTSSASSKTTFIYSSNPIICPSSLNRVSSYNQKVTRVLDCVGESINEFMYSEQKYKSFVLTYLKKFEDDIDGQCHHLFDFLRRRHSRCFLNLILGEIVYACPPISRVRM